MNIQRPGEARDGEWDLLESDREFLKYTQQTKLYASFKAKCKNVIAFFYGSRTQCWNFRSVFAITLASTARLLKKMVDKAVNGAAGNRTHDPITKIGVYVRLQILTIAVIGFR